ncbi:hypothetical protein ACWGKS_29605 [Nocardiopsis sp. NPDC055879]
MLRVINEEEMDFIDEFQASYQGEGFTGYAVELDSGFVNYRTYISGIARGPEYTRTSDGMLDSFSHVAVNQPVLGGSYTWGEDGELLSEIIFDDSQRIHTVKKWDSFGSLTTSRVGPEVQHQENGYGQTNAWKRIPKVYPPGEIEPGQFAMTVSVEHLDFDETRGKYGLHKNAYTGDVFYGNVDGTVEVRTMVDGRQEGSVFRWSAQGGVIAQGVCRHPYGLVGPWHEWDEQGRLLRETIYDALGNKIIHRELDENQNIVKQERFEPATLMTDPETGEQHPAPWL